MSRSRLSKGGMTLVEMCVYCVLLGIFTTILFISLPGRANSSIESATRSTAKGGQLLSLLAVELNNGSTSSVIATTSPPGLLFLVAGQDPYTRFTYTQSGAMAWKGWVGYFWQGTKLTRYWLPLATPTERAGVGNAPLSTIGSGKATVLASNVRGFAVSSPEVGVWQISLTLDFEGSQTIVRTSITARNP